MSTPGAAIFTTRPKLLKYAKVSSAIVPLDSLTAGPEPPHLPSVSPIADTVNTLGLLAGVVVDASLP